MNFNDLLETLSAVPTARPLVFQTSEGDVGAGYHVTEFKHANVTGIDCGAHVSSWSEASMQLLDGEGREHMKLKKFTGILRKSIEQIDGMGDAPIRVEFAPGNDGMRTYEMKLPQILSEKVVIPLRELRAICKPAQEQGGTCGSGKGCDPSTMSGACCA